jgi:hypothetical protein
VVSPKMLGRVFRPAEGVFFGSAPPLGRLCGANRLRLLRTLHPDLGESKKTLSVPHSSRPSYLPQLIAPEILSIPVLGET